MHWDRVVENDLSRLRDTVSFLDVEYASDVSFSDVPPSDVTEEWSMFVEGLYMKLLQLEFFPSGTITQCRIPRPFHRPKHRHREMEIMVILEGEVVDIVSGKVAMAGDFMRFEAGVYHEPVYRKPTTCLKIWIPPLEKRKRSPGNRAGTQIGTDSY